jgi:hypothetical protein
MSRELNVVVKMGSYCRRKTLSSFVVDANSCGLMQIIDHITEHFMGF